MPGMNLAQSAQGTGRHAGLPHIGSGLLFLVGVVVAVVVVWGGLSVYEGILTDGIAEAESRIERERADMPQGKIDQIADFQLRIDRIAAESEPFDASKLLDSFGEQILPGVVLTNFSFDAVTKVANVEGEADSFRTVAQQMTAFKKLDNINELTAPSLERNEQGRISFSFSVAF
ncbi:MAG: hypothetical protein HGA38_02885 [Candidatus Moranbacteria bacterium]|nr:hypothetical protein [Candidatus Moranbacteria bacterium]